MAKGHNFNLVKGYSEYMKENPTPSEKKFYEYIEQLRPLTGHISKQHHFIGRTNAFVLDVYLPEKRLGFEIDGGYHHTEEQEAKDKFKDNYLRAHGITIVRLTNEQAMNEWVCQLIILEAIKAPKDIIDLHRAQPKPVMVKLRKKVREDTLPV